MFVPARWPALRCGSAVTIVGCATATAAVCLVVLARSRTLLWSAAAQVCYHSLSELVLAITDGQLATALQQVAAADQSSGTALHSDAPPSADDDDRPRALNVDCLCQQRDEFETRSQQAHHLRQPCAECGDDISEDAGHSEYMPVFSFTSLLAMSIQNLVQLFVGPHVADCRVATIFSVLATCLGAVAVCCALVRVAWSGAKG